MGINVPIRSVVFTQLWKYDGQKAAILSVRDFRQVAGRAGRKGYDDLGHVIVQAPEHVIENKRAEERAASHPKKKKKLVKARAPEGSVGWDAATFEKLMQAPAEALVSRFEVSHGMLLQVLSREGDGCRTMRQIIADCHESIVRKKQLRRRTWQLFRSLLDRRIIEWVTTPQASGRKLRVNVDLQDDFSLHQALSLFLLDTLALLDRASPDYPLDVLTLCEAIVEDPDAILRRQVDKLKNEKFEELKAADVPFDERMEKLEQIEHPKPLREFLYEKFNAFSAAHPWVEKENIRPKSIAREMFERYQSFADYVREYGLQRMEGLLLRHLTQAWKVLSQTVPDSFKTPEVVEMEDYLRELIRGIDSSLLEEWERLKNPDFVAVEAADKPARPASFDVTRDKTAFTRLLRIAIYAFLQDAAAREWESALERLRSGEAGATSAEGEILSEEARKLETAFKPYFEEHMRFRLDPAGRSALNTHIEEDDTSQEWRVAQMLIDSEDMNDWELRFVLSLAESRAQNRPVFRFESVSKLG